jgi:3-oxoacyl-[acyl-carrier protein] reductase
MELPESSYPDLTGRRVVVAGGTGAVGEGIVRCFLRAGAEVIVPTRTQQRLEEFRGILQTEARADRLTLMVADYTTIEAAEELARRLQADPGSGVTDVVSTIGGWWAGGTIWQTSRLAWEKHFTEMATAHFAMARAWVPKLPPHGSYQVILGGSAIQPSPGSGIVSMQQAAILMMGNVLQVEAGEQRRVFTNLLGPVNNRNRRVQRPEWVAASDVGLIATLLSGDASIRSRHVRLLDKSDLRGVLAELGATDPK